MLVGRLLGDSILHFHCLLFSEDEAAEQQLPYFCRSPSEGTKMLYFANQHRLAALHRKHTTVLLVSPIFSLTAFFSSAFPSSAVSDAFNGRNSNNRICVRFTLPPPPPLFTLCNKTALFAVVLFLVFVFVFFLPKL